ncbi:helix-turn-helix domain-containing protein [Enterococcus sp. AZ194]|uniref:helix-turn-helix domain-containing protein n=1 Tax=Enterococcus sp. AZ194 TaxID=2774629 RepID=UPI003F68530B
MNLQKNIRTLRRQQGLTQNELAQKLTISAGAVSKWETGMSLPDTEHLLPLAKLFGVSLDQLFGFEFILSEQRLTEIEQELRTLFQTKGFTAGINKMSAYINDYPNVEKLQFVCAKLAWDYRLTASFVNEEEVNERLQFVFEQFSSLFEAENQKIRMDSLYYGASIMMTMGNYEMLEKLLQQIPEMTYDTLPMKLMILEQKKEYGKAATVVLETLFSTVNKLLSLIGTQTHLQDELENKPQKKRYLELLKKTERLFETISPTYPLLEIEELIAEDSLPEAAKKVNEFVQDLTQLPIDYRTHFLFSELTLSANEWEVRHMRMLYMKELLNKYRVELAEYLDYEKAALIIADYCQETS